MVPIAWKRKGRRGWTMMPQLRVHEDACTRYHVQVVRECTDPILLDQPNQLTSPLEACRFFWRSCMESAVQELFVMLCLDMQNAPIGWFIISRGGLAVSIVEPRAVFQRALAVNAASIICAHNHPSGNTDPSREDIRITRQLVSSGELIGVPVHDHIIVCGEVSYTSLAEQGYL